MLNISSFQWANISLDLLAWPADFWLKQRLVATILHIEKHPESGGSVVKLELGSCLAKIVFRVIVQCSDKMAVNTISEFFDTWPNRSHTSFSRTAVIIRQKNVLYSNAVEQSSYSETKSQFRIPISTLVLPLSP